MQDFNKQYFSKEDEVLKEFTKQMAFIEETIVLKDTKVISYI